VIALTPAVRVDLAAEPTDMRKSFDDLSALVEHGFGKDPLSGHLFVFRNRRGNHLRVLFWDRTGYAILGKKLARGCFHLARQLPPGATHVEVEAAELSLMLEGIDLSESTRRTRWRPANTGVEPRTSRSLAGLSASPAGTTSLVG
jgi:transposase